MRTPMKRGAYATGLVAVFAAATGLGNVVGPDRATASHSNTHNETGTAADAAHVPGGLQVTEDGYRLAPLSGSLATGEPAPLRFQILGPDAAPLTRYTNSHDKDLHLIVVRWDLTGFQHLHPVLAADGTWSVPLAVAAPGQYRVFADFQPAGRPTG